MTELSSFPHSAYGPFSDGKVFTSSRQDQVCGLPVILILRIRAGLRCFSDSDSDGDGDWGLVCDDSF